MVTLPEISRSLLSFFAASSLQARQIGDAELAAMAAIDVWYRRSTLSAIYTKKTTRPQNDGE